MKLVVNKKSIQIEKVVIHNKYISIKHVAI